MQVLKKQINWKAKKADIKARWSQLSDESIETVKDNLNSLSDAIQSAYGYAKEKADLEMEAFMSSIHARTAPQSISQKLSKHTLNLKKKRTHSKKAI
jgi:hypothetical protein